MRGFKRGMPRMERNAGTARARMTILGALSATIALATTGTAAFQADTLSSTRQSSSDDAVRDTRIRSEITVPPEPAKTEYYESVSTSPDQQTETRQYSATTQDDNGNTSSQNHRITTDIDGNTAVDVSLDTNSSTSGSSSSSTSVNVDMSSSTQIRSSSGP